MSIVPQIENLTETMVRRPSDMENAGLYVKHIYDVVKALVL